MVQFFNYHYAENRPTFPAPWQSYWTVTLKAVWNHGLPTVAAGTARPQRLRKRRLPGTTHCSRSLRPTAQSGTTLKLGSGSHATVSLQEYHLQRVILNAATMIKWNSIFCLSPLLVILVRGNHLKCLRHSLPAKHWREWNEITESPKRVNWWKP